MNLSFYKINRWVYNQPMFIKFPLVVWYSVFLMIIGFSPIILIGWWLL